MTLTFLADTNTGNYDRTRKCLRNVVIYIGESPKLDNLFVRNNCLQRSYGNCCRSFRWEIRAQFRVSMTQDTSATVKEAHCLCPYYSHNNATFLLVLEINGVYSVVTRVAHY